MKHSEIKKLSLNFNIDLETICDYLAIINYSIITNKTSFRLDSLSGLRPFFKKLPMLNKSLQMLEKEPHDLISKLVEYMQPSAFNIEDNLSTLRYLSTNKKTLKDQGIVFTPKWLADKVTSDAVGHWSRLHRTGREIKSIGDLSCGTGVFISSLKAAKISDATIYGRDIDDKSVEYAKLLCHAVKISADLNTDDSLLSNKKITPQQKFDILIGNPPYVRSQNLNKNYSAKLQEEYGEVLKGNYDLVVAFLEHATRHLNEGGLASYIVSSRFMHSKYGRKICHRILNHFRLVNITDFGDSQLFPSNMTYTAVITFANLPPANKLTITHFPLGLTTKSEMNKGETFAIKTSSLENFPWNLKNSESQKIMAKLGNLDNPLLPDVFDSIKQGIRTGANEIYICDNFSKLEKGLLVKPIFGEDIKSYSLREPKKRLIFPYRLVDEKYAVIPEEQLQVIAPNIYKLLLSKKSTLQLRKQDNSNEWYAYSRNQNLKMIDERKILVKEMMPTAQIAYIKDRCASMAGYSLTSETLSDVDMLTWTAILNTPIMEYSLRQYGEQLHSGWFRLMKHHLERVRLPKFSGTQWKVAQKLSKRLFSGHDDVTTTLNQLVADTFGLTNRDVDFITSYLDSKHMNSITNHVEQKKMKSKSNYEPVKLSEYNKLHREAYDLRRSVTFQLSKNTPIHRWFPYTQGYSKDLVNYLINYMEVKRGDSVLDPFVGVGTTLIEAKRQGINSQGVDVSPLVVWISRTKIESLKLTKRKLEEVEAFVAELPLLNKDLGISFETNHTFEGFMVKAFSPAIRYQVSLVAKLIDLSQLKEGQKDFLKLALISIMEKVSQIRKHGSHYRFMLNESSVGLQKLNIKIVDPESDLRPHLQAQIKKMVADIISEGENYKDKVKSEVLLGDIREISLKKDYYDAVITSPPYLNRNNYIAQQKTELGTLNMVANIDEYKKIVKQTLRSHTDADLDPSSIKEHHLVTKIIKEIKLNDGNNKAIPTMIAGYFHDMEQVIIKIRKCLKVGAKAAFVVGNSRWGGVVVPVDHILAKIGEEHGLKAEEIIVTRLKGNSPQQMKQYGRIPVRESILIFKRTS